MNKLILGILGVLISTQASATMWTLFDSGSMIAIPGPPRVCVMNKDGKSARCWTADLKSVMKRGNVFHMEGMIEHRVIELPPMTNKPKTREWSL